MADRSRQGEHMQALGQAGDCLVSEIVEVQIVNGSFRGIEHARKYYDWLVPDGILTDYFAVSHLLTHAMTSCARYLGCPRRMPDALGRRIAFGKSGREA